MKTFKEFIKNILIYHPSETYNFTIDHNNSSNENNITNSETTDLRNISSNITENKNYLKYKYNTMINSDILIRDFTINLDNQELKSFVIFIDGMIDSALVNQFLLQPLMQNNKIIIRNQKNTQNNISENIKNNIIENFIPQCNLTQVIDFQEAFSSINMGNCLLFIDTLNIAFNFDVKGFKQRSINTPNNEVVVRGSQEAFVENIRANTSILRRLVNNENLIIENTSVGKITKTKVSICYLQNIANSSLISEIRLRIKNLEIDALLSSGQLEQLIQDNPSSLFPQIIATERPDKAATHLIEGRCVVLVNGSPYALIMPGIFVDFLSSPEDLNLKSQYTNLEKIIRLIAVFFSVLLPGLYIAITNYHQELIPTELLFTINSARESVPFPTFIEILLMETSFELIREAGLRVPSPLGSTIGIVGALILGEAAVSASLVSPVLIIIVAITGICSFSIPDLSLNFTFRIYRFIYIILGHLAGFLGISCGLFVQLLIMCNLQSFGSEYLSPYIINRNKNSISSYFLPPIWKRDKTSEFLHSKNKYTQRKISMNWRKNK